MELRNVLGAIDCYILPLILDFSGCLVDLAKGALDKAVRNASFADFFVPNENTLPGEVRLVF